MSVEVRLVCSWCEMRIRPCNFRAQSDSIKVSDKIPTDLSGSREMGGEEEDK